MAWHTYGTETNGASDFVKATVAANGTFTAKVVVDHPGVTSTMWVDVNGKVSKLWSISPIAAANITNTTPKMTFVAAATDVLPATGKVTVTATKAGGSLDFSKALAKTGWDGMLSDLSKYVSTKNVDSGHDLQLSVHGIGLAASLIATLDGQGGHILFALESHAVF